MADIGHKKIVEETVAQGRARHYPAALARCQINYPDAADHIVEGTALSLAELNFVHERDVARKAARKATIAGFRREAHTGLIHMGEAA